MRFTKMQGCGNDYVYVNGFDERVDNPSELARAISDRHFGVGSDGLILILPSSVADFRMAMYNADGSSAEMCGNGIRCVGKYVRDKKMTLKDTVRVETGAGIKTLTFVVADGHVAKVTVDMGAPTVSPKLAQLSALGLTFEVTLVSMGNPHAVCFIDDTSAFPVDVYGPVLENDPLFPNRSNIEFVEVISPDHVKMRVWERGSGETLACGTGTCAVCVASHLRGLTGRKTRVDVLGGSLDLHWDEVSGHVFMAGSAEFVFEGEWPYRHKK